MNFRELPYFSVLLIAAGCLWTFASAKEIALGEKGFESHVKPFFEKYCTDCHGPEKSKGDITVHSLDGDLLQGQELDKWEYILDVLQHVEMPPEDKPQPSAAESAAVQKWIESGLRGYVEKASKIPTATTTRRLTNFEYQNTMRDLLGFELQLAKDLPEDPNKPYHFNNTAELMLIGPDQLVRYKEAARKAMESAIVDLEKPKVHRKVVHSKPAGNRGDLQPQLIGVYQGAGPGSSAVVIPNFPKTGEFRVKVKAAAVLPEGFRHVPLRLVMGTTLRGDARAGIYHPLGTVSLTKNELQEFEFRGRIENIPVEPKRNVKNKVLPPRITITAQNIFDNGQLNDHRKSGHDWSWSKEAPQILMKSLEFEAPIIDEWPPQHHKRIMFDSPLRAKDPEKYAYEVVKHFMNRAFRRPVQQEEAEKYFQIYKIFQSEFDSMEEAMRETLSTVLISPHFLYHNVYEGPDNKAYEMANKLSYFLWGSMPDDELMLLAKDGKLLDPAVLEGQIGRLLADDRVNDFVDNFTTQWLSISKMKTISINRDLFPRFLYTSHVGQNFGRQILFRPTVRDYMHEETVGFVSELIRRNASVLQIIDSDFAYLNERLAAHYGVDNVYGVQLRPVPIKPEHRLGGLLTHGSILVGNSTGSAPHPIYRAVWLREAILGDKVKPPPAEVPALADSAGETLDESSSIKELLALHRTKESCHDCHFRLDPWGIPFEHYNAVGKYQPKVPKDGAKVRGFSPQKDQSYENYSKYLKSVFTVDVDASSRVPHGPQITGMDDLKKYLLKHKEKDIVNNVIRRLMSYGIGRELTYRDRFAVDEIFEQAEGNGFKLAEIIVAVCKSETFTGINTHSN